MPEQEQQDADRNGGGRISEPVYTRTIPGGGRVRVELVVSDRGAVAQERLRGRVVVEAQGAASEEALTVVEEVEGSDANQVVAELFRIAHDNAAIARGILRQRATRAD